jgi:HAE1 family hydrophobic/amphiphilic exporter-1
VPSLELNQPEMQLQPDEWRIARSGLTRGDVSGRRARLHGRTVGGWYFDGNERLDIIVKAGSGTRPRSSRSCRS